MCIKGFRGAEAAMLTKGVSRTGVRRNIGRNGNKGKKTESQLPKMRAEK